MVSLLSPSPRRREKSLGRALVAIALALVVHGLVGVLALLLSLLHFGEEKKRPQKQAITLRTVNGEQWLKNRGEQQKLTPEAQAKNEPAPEKKPEQKKVEKEKRPEGQVVATPPGNNEQDEKAKYLAESNNKVKKETRAKETTPFYRNAQSKRTADHAMDAQGQDAADQASRQGNNGMGSDDRPLREGGDHKPVFEVPDLKAQQQIAMKMPNTLGPGADVQNHAESVAMPGNSQRFKVQQGNAGASEETSMGKTGAPNARDLLPSAATIDKIIGAAANDHLKDVDEGDGTYLNTKEWKYASFFNRVKQSVGMTWNPGAQLRQRDPTLQIYGGRDRYTVVNVTLTDQGRVREIFVEKSCGLDFLDLEAMQAFERAQPFPNPPPGLIENDQKVRFSFGFYLELTGSPHTRLFRSD